jgi:hypothetical protein
MEASCGNLQEFTTSRRIRDLDVLVVVYMYRSWCCRRKLQEMWLEVRAIRCGE